MRLARAPWPRLALAAAALLLLAGRSAGAPLRLADERGREVVLAAPALRIVSLLPSLTETVCALDACERLVGTDRYSNWPASVRALPKLGGLEDTQIERVVALRPDLVLAARSARALDRLDALGVATLALEPQNLAQTRQAIATVARALGRADAGRRLIERLDERLTAAVARVPAALRGKSVYLEVASTPHAAGQASYAGELLARLGLVNIVPAALGPFPQLNPEFVLRAQPDIVMATAAVIAQMPRRPGWAALAALRTGQLCGFDAEAWDTLVRPGPRLADAAEAIVDCLDAIAQRDAPRQTR
ncbi:MAG: helical backbone metal receptor [Rubrivivax sp.]